MMPLGLFRSRDFSGANLLTLLLYGALGEVLFFLPFNLIQVQGYLPTEAGAAFIPFIVIMFALSRWSGGLVARFGGKLPLVVGPVVAGIGMALFALPEIGGSYWTTFFLPVVVLGLGMAVAVAPLTTVVMSAVSQQNAGIASGINNAASRTASLLSIATFGIVVVQVFISSLDSRLTTLRVSQQLRSALDAQRASLTEMQIPGGTSAAFRLALEHAIDQAFVDAFRVAVLAGAALALLSAVIAAIMIQGKKPEPVQQDAPARAKPVPATELGGTA
jgi:MFS family permease